MPQYDYTAQGKFNDEQLAVLTVAAAFLRGIETRDKALMLEQVLPAGGATLLREGKPLHTTLAGVVERIPFDTPMKMAEVISGEATVLVDNDIAMAWTPYEFWIDGKLDHVGTNIWSFVKLGNKWLVSGVADNSRKP